MKAYTDLLQSKELAKILPLDSADMSYTLDFDSERYEISTTSYKSWIVPKYAESYKGLNQVLPCWSLAALLNVLPDNVVIDGHRWSLSMNKKSISYLGHMTYDGQLQISVESDNSVDSCYEMILKLKEMNLLN